MILFLHEDWIEWGCCRSSSACGVEEMRSRRGNERRGSGEMRMELRRAEDQNRTCEPKADMRQPHPPIQSILVQENPSNTFWSASVLGRIVIRLYLRRWRPDQDFLQHHEHYHRIREEERKRGEPERTIPKYDAGMTKRNVQRSWNRMGESEETMSRIE